ncbi:MAG: D-Ala-D-Ala carboxypeptidase family metallohydrolase, partial [bacterium]
MTYQFRLRKEPFDFSYEFDDYENGLLQSDPEFADLEEEEEARQGPRAAGSTIRGHTPPVQLRRPPPRRRRPPRTIIRPWRRVSGGVIHEPSPCTCPEQTCPQHGSEYIRWVQSTLNRILGMRLPLNAVLTPATRSAIRSFQKQKKLPVTGIVGPDTERALIAASSGQSPGAGATKRVEPGIMEPPEPAATPPEPGMTEPAEPAPTSPAAEFEFEWEVTPLGQRETQRLTYSGQVARFPSGEILPVVTGLPIGKNQDYWDPTGSGNPLLDTGPAHKDKKLSTSFTVRELTTSGGVSADIARIDPKLVECLQRLRDHVGKGVKITSGFRSWKRNRDIYEKRGKTPTLSQHCAGRGADIHIAGMNGLEIGKAAIDACGPNIGVGLANTYAHIDVRGLAAAW